MQRRYLRERVRLRNVKKMVPHDLGHQQRFRPNGAPSRLKEQKNVPTWRYLKSVISIATNSTTKKWHLPFRIFFPKCTFLIFFEWPTHASVSLLVQKQDDFHSQNSCTCMTIQVERTISRFFVVLMKVKVTISRFCVVFKLQVRAIIDSSKLHSWNNHAHHVEWLQFANMCGLCGSDV